MKFGTVLLILLAMWVGLEAGYRIGHAQGQRSAMECF